LEPINSEHHVGVQVQGQQKDMKKSGSNSWVFLAGVCASVKAESSSMPFFANKGIGWR